MSYVSRVNQIDAVQLDEEIYKVLRNQARQVGKHLPIDQIDRWQPEVDAILKYFMWTFSLRDGKSTFGQQLLNLHYENVTRAKSLLYLMLTIVPEYARDKLAGNGGNRNLGMLLDYVGDVMKLLEFVNLLVFLHRGTQPQVIEYLLGIASRSTTTHKPRNIGYSYMTRELLWHSLMELFTTGLPMINFHYLKCGLKKLFTRTRRDDLVRRFYPTMDAFTNCAYCDDTPILPVHAGCQHVFCYYCMKAHFTATNEFQCSECGTRLHVRNMRTYETSSSVSYTRDDNSDRVDADSKRSIPVSES
ncbi:peroxisome biogenesis factor 2 [Ceratina calcarata]|uniref:RING-type E3 ubiquitin transferase (cysteine targeting) n=1 Tax=Ceratina calcarata TaxID=156304 RepID=A0AAJ7NAU2_9HYME|nr:peroxisome biogenesis factor 2 [Ceratina calcarata]